ncbi:helix-turn-helix domain-containing protein [Paenibacillus thalictri]|nr:helix-turn-helix domain-containing protein [Paenibacillus thalictri]
MSKSLMPSDASAYLDTLLQMALSSYIFQLHRCFNVTVKASWRIDERVLDEVHLLFVRSGCATYEFGGRSVKLTAGSLLVVSDGTMHSASRNLSEPLSIITVRFRIVRYKEDRHMPTANPCYFFFQSQDTQKFRLLFEAIHRHHCLPPSVKKDALCHASICQTLAEMSRELEELEQNKPTRHAIMQIKGYIDTNPLSRLSVKELAALSGLSPKYCSLLFRQSTGLTIKEYQIKSRIEYAAYLLEHSSQSVKEISLQLGYPDPFVFSKQYKAVTGIAPSETLRSGTGK